MKTLFNKFAVMLLGVVFLATLSFASYGRVSYDEGLSKISVEKKAYTYILKVAPDAATAKIVLKNVFEPLFDIPVTKEYAFSGTVMYISFNHAKYDNTYINGVLNERRRQKSNILILT